MKPSLANNTERLQLYYVISLHEKPWKEGMFFAAGMSIVFFPHSWINIRFRLNKTVCNVPFHLEPAVRNTRQTANNAL